jgi:hypothetical protein
MTDRDYPTLLPRVLARLFPDPTARSRADAILGSYGQESYHNEIERVRLGILRLAGADLAGLERWTALARMDYRDLLVAAEYPRTFARDRLRERDPAKYAALGRRERAEYDAWLASVLGE